MTDKRILVAGAGGFIGGHLVKHLLDEGAEHVVAVDRKPETDWYQTFPEADNRILDLQLLDACHEAVRGVDVVYNLAADMGGMGFIENNKAACMLSVLINTHLLQSAVRVGVERYFYASSACVYARYKQSRPDVRPLAEGDAYPADPEDGYGWEKLFSERMCRHFSEDFGLTTRVARYHNVYGPHGTWKGGREKAPAAICRKIAQAQLSGRHEIEIWGDGEQTRSFMYIDDCIEGTRRIMDGDVSEPINLGGGIDISIAELARELASVVGYHGRLRFDARRPDGAPYKALDASVLHALGWRPATAFRQALGETYDWFLQHVPTDPGNRFQEQCKDVRAAV